MRWTLTILVLTGLISHAPAQPRPARVLSEPSPLPAVTNSVQAASGTALVPFEPQQLVLKRVNNRCQLWAGLRLLKDFGPNEHDARDALRVVRDLHFTQYGTIAGATPVFEFWLAEGDSVKGGIANKTVIPFNAGALKVENVAGAWVIRDNSLLLYNFGAQQEAAEQALAVMKKFGFNQLGLVGIPNPVMTYLTVDAHVRPQAARGPADPKEILGSLAQQSLMLPNIGYVGSRMPIEQRKLEVARVQNDWAVAHGKDVIARFGPNLLQAREALRLLYDAHVTELCLIGKNGFPIFLCNGQPPRRVGLGFNNLRMQTAALKVQMINNVACITEKDRIVFEFGGNTADAELVLKVLQHFQFDQVCPVGDPAQGGLRLLIRSK